MTRGRNPWLKAYAGVVYAVLFAPIVVLILFSFNDSKRNFIWQGFTLRWYPELFADLDGGEIGRALGVTLQVAVVSVIVTTILGTLLGLGLARLRSRRAAAASDTLILLPMVTPEIVMGISLLLFFSLLFRANGSILQITVAHIAFSISYVAILVRSRAVSLDPRMEEAARDLGAGPRQAFFHVTLPLIAPAVAAGALLAFALSFDDLIITSFNAGVGSSTLPLYIYSRIRFGVTPEINAISTIVVVGTGIVVLLATWISSRRARRRSPAAAAG
jgi:ABC-type spermidine/putrescine transport system permease subunit II